LQEETLLFDAYCYDPHTSKWKKLSNIKTKNRKVWCLAGAPSTPVGLNNVLIFGGADSKDHRLFRVAQLNYNHAKNSEEKALYRAKLEYLTDHHSGYSRDILSYHTLTDQWVRIGEFPSVPPVVTKAVLWDKKIIIPAGEVAPAKRSQVYGKPI
jgi:N-acetylneuraminic acid mutarotase